MLGRFSRDAGSFTGIEIVENAVRVVQLRKRKRRFEVLCQAQEFYRQPAATTWMTQPAHAAAALRRAFERHGVRQHRVAMALPADQVICKPCRVPRQACEEQIEAQLLADAERLLPFALDDLAMDFHVLGPCLDEPNSIDVMVAACRQSTLALAQSVVTQAGLQLDAIEVDTVALARLLPPGCSDRAALLRIDLHNIVLHRWQPRDLCQRWAWTSTEPMLSGELPEQFAAALVSQGLPADLWVSGGACMTPQRLQAMSERLEVRCRALPALDGLEGLGGPMLLAGTLAAGGLRA
ncbi:type IV pilus biogenesis protein PilM [Pseudomonas fulva]|uniref:type IV pilus biogenesis protein PilM n=1 Tax=Pseudomonas fulva TaxID=47880 RepID=UPI00346375E9